MTEGLNMAALGSAALSEGIKFLYSQAAEALKRWRERQDRPATREPSPPPTPPVFADSTASLAFHLDKVEALEEPLRKLMHSLADYAAGNKPINPGNSELIAAIHALRLAMEQVHQQPLTFKDEQRSGGAPGIIGSIGSLIGAAIALEAGQARGEEAAPGRPEAGEEPSLLGIRIGRLGLGA